MKVVYFDLDGPLLDVSEKYYQTYSDILIENDFEPLNKTLYWELKRNKTPELEILRLTKAELIYEKYKILRKSIIETDKYLKYDSLQDGAEEVLNSLFDLKYKIFLVTLRSSRSQLESQLKQFKIHKYFECILSSGLETDPRWKIKFDLISNHGKDHPYKNSFFFGDTETDIISANELGLRSVAVLNGIRNLEKIKAVSPFEILPGISNFNLNSLS